MLEIRTLPKDRKVEERNSDNQKCDELDKEGKNLVDSSLPDGTTGVVPKSPTLTVSANPSQLQNLIQSPKCTNLNENVIKKEVVDTKSDVAENVGSLSSVHNGGFSNIAEAEIKSENDDFKMAEQIIQLATQSKLECMELYNEANRLKIIKLEKEKVYRDAKEMWLKAEKKAREWKMNKEEVTRILCKTEMDTSCQPNHLQSSQNLQSQQLHSQSVLDGLTSVSQTSAMPVTKIHYYRPASTPKGVAKPTKLFASSPLSTPCGYSLLSSKHRSSFADNITGEKPMDRILMTMPLPPSQISDSSVDEGRGLKRIKLQCKN